MQDLRHSLKHSLVLAKFVSIAAVSPEALDYLAVTWQAIPLLSWRESTISWNQYHDSTHDNLLTGGKLAAASSSRLMLES